MRFFIYFCIVFFVLTGCSLKEPTLSEILKYEQNTAILPDAPIPSQDEFQKLNENFLEKYFAVWDKSSLWTSQKDASFGFMFLDSGNYAAENLIALEPSWIQSIKKLSNFDNYGSVLTYAITTQNTNLRLLPTDKPLFKSGINFDYPFDRLQNSFINIMQPLIISHYSEDYAWAFVESSFASGWIKSNELAVIDKQTMQEIKNAAKIVIVKDNAAVYYEEGLFAHYLKAGSILPIYEYKDGQYKAFIITTEKNGKGTVTNIVVNEKSAKPFPIEFNSLHVKQIIDELLNENYGWGGLYANRDCSAFTKDFFAIYGIWLPRNSLAQKNAALYFDISNLTAAQKEEKLKELAEPYLTLIYMPGHIMLYVGEIEGRAVVVHNIWGIRTKGNDKYIIGKSIISDLYLGENLQNTDTKNLLINKIKGFTVLTPKNTKAKIKLLNVYKDYISSIKNNIIYFKNGKTVVFDDNKHKTYEEMLEYADVQDQFYETYAKGTPKEFPSNDAGRIRNENFLKEIYGSSKEEVEKNLVTVIWLPSSANISLLFNKNNGAAKALQAVSNELDKLNTEHHGFLHNIAGTYMYRNIADTSRLSAHAFGIAIDLNVKKANYWLWDVKTKKIYDNSFPQEIVDIFEKHGFIWGGKWLHYDTMHFEYRPELL